MMRKYLFYSFTLAVMLTITSCIKDKGNYTYHAINQSSFSGIDTVNGYRVYYQDTLKITPVVNNSLDKSGTGSYSYKWVMSVGLNPVNLAEIDSTVSTSKNLSTRIIIPPGSYKVMFYVTDNKTGVTFQTRATVTVVSKVFEGYLLLNNVNGQSRLDMLSYSSTSQSFTQYIDVLGMMGSTVPMNGTPYQVYCAQFVPPNINPEPYGIFILNGAGANRVDQETFAYDHTLSVNNMFIGNLPQDFAPTHMFSEGIYGLAGYPELYMFDGAGNVYWFSSFAGYAFHYTPLNVYTASGTPFKVAPYGVFATATAEFYNSDKKTFVTANSYNVDNLADVGSTQGFPTGLDMVYMDKDYNNNAFAIMKDPATSNMYFVRFPIGGNVSYNKQILGTDISQATHFAVSPVFGYLFYSVGGKVYEYDPSLQKSILMVDEGSNNITYLNFNHFFNRTSSTVNSNYATWANYLEVASYGSSPTSGTFTVYNVLPINGQITQVPNGRWTGFGDIVSVSYRER